MHWMLQYYESDDQIKRNSLEEEYKLTFPDSLSNGDLLQIGVYIDQWTGFPRERTPGWIHYMTRLRERVKTARDNVEITKLKLRFKKCTINDHLFPDVSNIVGEYFIGL